MAYAYGGRAPSTSYEDSAFLGYLSGGMDVHVAKNISVGAEFKYYQVLSSSQNNNFSNYYGMMYYNPNPAYSYGASDTAVAGTNLASSNFYSILGDVSFSF
jgi:hypothetical protein